jgi:hypothetical protein
VLSGGTLVIHGSGFGAVQCAGCGVLAGNSPLPILSWSDQTITVLAPELTGVQKITVQTGDGADVLPAMTALPAFTPAGSLAQVASQGTWTFSINAVNLTDQAATARFHFLSDAGAELGLPLSFPQFPGVNATLSALDRTIAPHAQFLMESAGPDGAPQLTGWSEMMASNTMAGYGIFSNAPLHWNALVPLETRNEANYTLAFDNTADGANALSTGVAVANISSSPASIPVTIRDDAGTAIGSATIDLPARGHASFMLGAQYAAAAGKRGTIRFDTPGGGQISVLGLRAYGTEALTSLPVLGAAGAGGGSMAHVAFQGGFTSTFYLVNTGAGAADFTLDFFDEAGAPLAVPLAFPQTGASQTAASLTRNLAAGAVLVIQASGDAKAAAVTGSAQLTTGGSVSGFEVFRWTTFHQEASVALETRSPGTFLFPFDNTGDLSTGVALANRSGGLAAISVLLRDDSGAVLQSDTIHLAAHAHVSFMLNDASRYPLTAGRRGTIEFAAAPGAIAVTALRAKPDGTLTTIPVFAK